jgi:prepilin-type N-terminal cleavage/methylation domain-containing protein
LTKAFSLIELIFVIVIIGIISSFIIPSIKTNPLQEAAIQLASDIRYTQHLAMNDDKFDKNENNWYKKRWRIKFFNKNRANNKWSYSIFYEGDGANNAKLYSMAKNPLNINIYMSGGYNITGTTEEKKKLDYSENNESGLFIGTKKLNIGSTYGITNISFKNGCSGRSKYLSFDYLGRVFKKNPSNITSPYTNNLIDNDCKIELYSNSKKIVIVIKAETGYVKIE